MWIQKYRPRCLKDIIGRDSTLNSLRKYDWKRPLLLYGSTGVGKTVIVEALANEMGMDLVKINNENIQQGAAIAESLSIFGNKRLILIDHVDEIENIKEVSNILDRRRNPVVLITSNISSRRLGTIKRKCQKLQIRKPRAESIIRILTGICTAEGISADRNVLAEIANNANGDITSAINDLEMIGVGRMRLQMEDTNILSPRDISIDIFKALNQILIKRDLSAAIKVGRDLQEQPKNTILWIDENTPRIYRNRKDIESAYYYLSRADIFIRRILRRQYWGFLRYVNPLMTAGVSISKKHKINFSPYQFPRYFARLGQTKKDRDLKRSIGKKLSPWLHASEKIVVNEYIPLFRVLLKNGWVSKNDLMATYRLGPDEIEYIEGSIGRYIK